MATMTDKPDMKYFVFLCVFLKTFSALALDCKLLGHETLGQQVLSEIDQAPFSCLKNNVHLTFDDGPSTTITPEILKELKLRKTQGTFFVTTTNLDPSHPKYKENREIVKQALSEGHLIADHGFEHHAHDLRMDAQGKVLEEGYDQNEREVQIKKSVDLLNWSTQGQFSKQSPLLFRFPYGRGAMPSEKELKHMAETRAVVFEGKTYSEQLKEYRQLSPALQTLASSGFSHLGWNHDSHDSSYGVKAPADKILSDYIIKNLKGLCSSPQITKVALFHDIKEMNLSAIPLIMDIGKCLGLKFISAKDMMMDQSLSKTGVLIDKNQILKGPVENVIKGLEIAKHPSSSSCSNQDIDKSCYSEQYQKRYAHCSGGDSVCFEGKWYSSSDPLIKNNCHLQK
jgi:peptidoglycan/xylan/chitin deacetylase (PgdA/CDA1 family)